MDTKDITIVIVSFKSDQKLIECLNSINDQVKVIVVENSNDENVKKNLERQFSNLECILTGENKGYAIANNIGLNQVKTKYALVLNPDTILEKNAIKNFLVTAGENKEFWLIGPSHSKTVESDFNNKLTEVNDLKGFAIFFNLSKFNNKFFDENFFLYFEEIDLCKRVTKEKGKIYLDKTIKVYHQGAASVINIDKHELEKNRNWHWMWSTFYYHKKYKGFFLSLIIIFPKLISAIIKMFFYLIMFNKKKRDVYYCRLSGILNSIIGNKSWYRLPLD